MRGRCAPKSAHAAQPQVRLAWDNGTEFRLSAVRSSYSAVFALGRAHVRCGDWRSWWSWMAQSHCPSPSHC